MRRRLRTCLECGARQYRSPWERCRACRPLKRRPARARGAGASSAAERQSAAERRADSRCMADPEVMARLAAAKQGVII